MFSATTFANRNGSLRGLCYRFAASHLCATVMPGMIASLLLTAAPAHASLTPAVSHRAHRSLAAAHRHEPAALRRGMTRRLALLRRRRPAAPLTGLDSVAFDDTGFGDAAASPPADAEVLDQGVASWYGGRRNGMRTSSGTRFNENEMTAAHYWLPLGTRVRVTRDGTDASVLVTITDRQGTGRRAIDLSKAAARRLGILGCGTARVTLTRG